MFSLTLTTTIYNETWILEAFDRSTRRRNVFGVSSPAFFESLRFRAVDEVIYVPIFFARISLVQCVQLSYVWGWTRPPPPWWRIFYAFSLPVRVKNVNVFLSGIVNISRYRPLIEDDRAELRTKKSKSDENDKNAAASRFFYFFIEIRRVFFRTRASCMFSIFNGWPCPESGDCN